MNKEMFDKGLELRVGEREARHLDLQPRAAIRPAARDRGSECVVMQLVAHGSEARSDELIDGPHC